MAEFNPYKLEEEKWTPKNVYEILPPNAVSWSDYDFGQGTDNVDQEAAKKSLIDGFVDFFKELLGTAGQILGGAIELGVGIFAAFAEGISNFIGEIADAIGGVFTHDGARSKPIHDAIIAQMGPVKTQVNTLGQHLQELSTEVTERIDNQEVILEETQGHISDMSTILDEQSATLAQNQEDLDAARQETSAAIEQSGEAVSLAKSYNKALTKRITTEFNKAMGEAGKAISQAEANNSELVTMNTQLGEITQQASDLNTKLGEHNKKFTDGLATANTAIDEAVSVTAAVKKLAEKNQAKVADAVSKAEKANADLVTLSPKVTDAVDKAGKASSDVSTLTPKVTSASEDAAKASQDVAALSPKVTDAVSKSDKAVADVAALNPKVTAASNKATQAASDVADLTPKVTAAQDKADKAASDLSTLTPKVTAAQSRADAAYTEAGKVRSEVTPKIEAAQSKGESALAVADKAIENSEFVAGFADDLIPKDANGKSTWSMGLASIDTSPEESAFGSERTFLMEGSFTFPEAFEPVKGQEVYRLTVWVYRDPNASSGGFSFHVVDENFDRRWVEARLNLGGWRTLDTHSNLYTTIDYDVWEKHILDFRWPESLGPARLRFQMNSGNAFYIHDPQVRVIQPLDNSVDMAQNDAIKANQDILRQQDEINAAQATANLAQDNFNANQLKWNAASTNATKALADADQAQKDINAEQAKFNNFQTEFAKDQIKWNKASSNATQALSDAAKAQEDINAEQKKFNNFQTQFNKDQTEWNDAVDRSIATQETVDQNFKIWTDGAAEAIEANKNAIAALNAPQIGSSIIPLIPGTEFPVWQYHLNSVDKTASNSATAALPESVTHIYGPPSGKLLAGGTEEVTIPNSNVVMVDPTVEYEASWWTYSSSGDLRYVYVTLEDETGNAHIVEKTDDEEASNYTSGNPVRAIITPATPTWTKYTTRFRFKEGTQFVRFSNIYFSNERNTNGTYPYIADLHIGPKIPNQAQVDDAQNKAIKANKDLLVEQERINQEQKKLNKLNTAFETEQKKINDKQTGINALNTKVQTAQDAATDALGRYLGISIGGRNLLVDSQVNVSGTDYLLAEPRLGVERPADGDEVTLSVKGQLGEGHSYFKVYNSGGNGSARISDLNISPEDLGSDGVYRKTGKWVDYGGNYKVSIYAYPSSAKTSASIEWVKLERGNQGTDWSPAPEEIPDQATLNQNFQDNFEKVDDELGLIKSTDKSFRDDQKKWNKASTEASQSLNNFQDQQTEINDLVQEQLWAQLDMIEQLDIQTPRVFHRRTRDGDLEPAPDWTTWNKCRYHESPFILHLTMFPDTKKMYWVAKGRWEGKLKVTTNWTNGATDVMVYDITTDEANHMAYRKQSTKLSKKARAYAEEGGSWGTDLRNSTFEVYPTHLGRTVGIRHAGSEWYIDQSVMETGGPSMVRYQTEDKVRFTNSFYCDRAFTGRNLKGEKVKVAANKVVEPMEIRRVDNRANIYIFNEKPFTSNTW